MSADSRRAAHLLLNSDLVYSPPNEAIITALLDLGYEVDLFAPKVESEERYYGGRVSIAPIEYNRRWLAANLWSPKWWTYDLFSGTSEDPLAVVGLVSFITRRPSFVLADEIKSGSYAGDAPRYWKRLCKWAMQRASFAIVNDNARIGLLQEYAEIEDKNRIIVYPGCYRSPPIPGSRNALRRQWGIPEDALVMGVSGGFNETSGAEWLLNTFRKNPALHIVFQPLNLSELAKILLRNIEGSNRIYLEPRRLGWREAWRTAPAMDIGLAVYLNPAPQFQMMGTSSNRLCMFLAMGIPVIANRQPSFEFVEHYNCGVLVETEQEFAAAIDLIANRLSEMKANALECTKEYIDAPGRYLNLSSRIAEL